MRRAVLPDLKDDRLVCSHTPLEAPLFFRREQRQQKLVCRGLFPLSLRPVW